MVLVAVKLLIIIIIFVLFTATTLSEPAQAAAAAAPPVDVIERQFGPFNSSYYNIFSVEKPATISNDALQITPDSANNGFSLQNKSGRVLFDHQFKLWEGGDNDDDLNSSSSSRVASFNISFLINIFRFPNSTSAGEGFAFIIAPDKETPSGSYGQYLGLTNSTTDGDPDNHLIAIELDTFKQPFDPDDNHLGLNINSIRSIKTVSLSSHGIEIAPLAPKKYMMWVRYNGGSKRLKVFMEEQGQPMPTNPLLNEVLDIRAYAKQKSYFGFAASTGNWTQLNCVLGWNLTVENLSGKDNSNDKLVKIVAGVGVPAVVLLGISVIGLLYYIYKKRNVDDPRIRGALKSLPGTPREFSFKDLKKATNNFDEKLKLGQGGFGVVYKGVLPSENTEVAVKKFSRGNIKGKDDFLAELSIINLLRHKHLVKLVGWCHKNGMLLLVYDYMPNGSLDNHLFGEGLEKILSWERRYKIIAGVASAIHYLHNEYDQKVVHRDLKASNIMLDSDFSPRLGDFGLARALDHEKNSYAELEGVPGTWGYIAPECLHTGKATRESDVFAFGAVVLEVVCGERPWNRIAGYQYLVEWVWTLHRDGRILEAVDERLGNDYVIEEAQRLLLLGLSCMHPIAVERPKTQSIVQIVSGSVPVPHVPPFRPAFVWPMMEPAEGDISNTSTMMSNATGDTTPMTSSYYGGSGWTPRSVTEEEREGYMGYSDSSIV